MQIVASNKFYINTLNRSFFIQAEKTFFQKNKLFSFVLILNHLQSLPRVRMRSPLF